MSRYSMELNTTSEKVTRATVADDSSNGVQLKSITITTNTTTATTVATTNQRNEALSVIPLNNENGTRKSYVDDIQSKEPVEIQFEDVTYTVKQGFKGTKKVLHEICGKFQSNKLIAIMGPSGAGKSTLLDLISGYRVGGIQGKILVNGEARILEEFRRISCYIQQDDRIQPLLTVEENMSIAADLKLGPKVSKKDKNALINEILSVLKLSECKQTRGIRLSGGQQKRLSIALELINNPMVMFLDEPTTGLDSSSCSQCILLLRQLAHQGRTIICTIHQPSASLFQMFDQVYILAQGQCLYQGTTDNMIHYLKNQHLPCPLYHNPADFVIEIASGDYGEDKIKTLIKGIDNGKNVDWFHDSKAIRDVERVDSPDIVKPSRKQIKLGDQMIPSYYQLITLLKRGIIKLKRDQTLTHMRIFVNTIVGLMLGMIYIGAGEDADKVLDNYNLLFTLIMHHVMSSMMLNIISFPMEMNIVLKEHFNRWYSLKMYYLANMILDIPVTGFSCVICSTIVFIMSSQLFEWYRFGLYTFTSLCLVFVSQAIGYIFGTVFDVVNGTFAGPIFIVPMMMFSGFGVNLRDIPVYLEWGTHVSFFRYALEIMVESIYGFHRRNFTCNKVYCHYKVPTTFLRTVAMENIDVIFAIEMLVLTLILTRILGYFVLSWKVRLGR